LQSRDSAGSTCCHANSGKLDISAMSNAKTKST
jgi:hypothetical protein